MPLKLNISSRAMKFIEALPAKQFKQIMNKVLKLLTNPTPHDHEQLKGYAYKRVDVGEYRIIYAFDELEVRVSYIGKRNDDEVYKALSR